MPQPELEAGIDDVDKMSGAELKATFATLQEQHEGDLKRNNKTKRQLHNEIAIAKQRLNELHSVNLIHHYMIVE